MKIIDSSCYVMTSYGSFHLITKKKPNESSDWLISLPLILDSGCYTTRGGDDRVWDDDGPAPGNGGLIYDHCDVSHLHSLAK